jgi:hypothetical protein
MRKSALLAVLAATVLGGCVSPYAKMQQNDLTWYSQDRYRFADAMPATNKDEGFKKIEAYWETIESIRNLKDQDTMLTLDGTSMKRDDAREYVRKKIKHTEEATGITAADYCARACVWTAKIPLRILKTPYDATMIGVESPVTNIEW